LLPFSCTRKRCPSCEARRRVEWADHVVENVLPDLAYRQLVFTVPRVLRHSFVRERSLLGEFVRTAYDVTREFMVAQFPGVVGGVPYFVGVFETWGSVVNVHPHVHALCSEGILDREKTFHALPADCDWSALEELFRHALLALLVARERLAETTRAMFLSWRHSGFGVDASSGAAAGDREGLHRLACYLHKPVLSLGRMDYAPGASKVLYHGKNDAAHGYGTVAYDPLEFMALVLAHVPEPHEVRVRYYGAASSTIRRGGRKGRLAKNAGGAGNVGGDESPAGPAAPGEAEENAYVKARRRTWAQLLARVYGVDALKCWRCGKRMKIIAFLTDPEVVEEILRHTGKWGAKRERGPPEQPHGGAGAAPHERHVVVDEYAQESDNEARDAGEAWGTPEPEQRECDWEA